MLSLIYASSTTRLWSDAELIALLDQSKRNNKSLGITGILLYHKGNFMQVLEGERQRVERLYTKITLDMRHRDVQEIARRTISEREYGDWSMSFVNLSDIDLTKVAGYSDFLDSPLHADNFLEKPTFTSHFLASFKEFLVR